MNPLGQLAQQWYQQYLPQAYQGIADKATFFGTLGEQAAQEIEQVATALAGDDPPGETFQNKIGRLQAAQQAATELVMRQTLLAQLPPDWPDSDFPTEATPDPSMPPTPSAEDVKLAEAMQEFSDARSELDQQNRASARQAMPALPPRPNLD
jgi:hypothetical protein